MFPPWSGMGFSDTATHRIYADAALGGILTITVAQPLAHRRAVTAGLMGSLALPLLLIVPFSLIGVWLAVRAGMAPLGRFRAGVEARGGADLSPFHLENLPAEFLPTARTLNHLLDRLRRTLEAERGFTANSAHELRTPLAAALAQMQRLLIEAPDGATRARAAQIEAALKRLARLSEKLLQLARAEGGGIEAAAPADLAPVLRLLADEMERDPARPITLDLPDAPVMARIDPDAFAILARNLIENAQRHGQDHGPPGATVRVSLSPGAVLKVANSGPVVPPDQLGRLAQPFQHGETAAQGSGLSLGLAIARAIAEGSGGRLDLFSPATGQAGGFEAIFSASGAIPPARTGPDQP